MGRGVLVAIGIALCATAPRAASAEERRPSVAVIVTGDRAPAEVIERALSGDHGVPVELAVRNLPEGSSAPESAPDGAIAASLATARQHYIAAEFDRCLVAVEGDEAVVGLLGTARRDLAARVLFWRTACHVGAGDLGSARRVAGTLAVHGLRIPPDVEAGTPEVEVILAEALREAEVAPRSALQVTSRPAGGVVRIDGGAPSCRTPCTADLVSGDHVVTVDSPGFVPASRLVRVARGSAPLSLDLVEASPEVAAAQWRARYAESPAIDSTESVALLARAVRARRLLLVFALEEGDGARLRGALSVDGRVSARAERAPETGEPGEAAGDLVRELLIEGQVMEPGPTVWESPWLWVGVAVAAAGAAAITAAVLYDPGVRTQVTW
jgi:hypothetical protein